MLEVRIDEARAPEQATHVRVADFDGPLGLLLSLIEARRLDVMTVPLGALAGAYLEALASLPIERLGNVSAFVAVASQLILIKSRALLPRPPASAPIGADEGPDPEAELRARLLIYRAHRDAGRALEAEAAVRRIFRREPSVAAAAARAGARPAPAPPLPIDLLSNALGALARIVPPPPPPPEVMPRTVTIGQRIEIIRAALRNADAIVLQELLVDVRDRVVRAVTFLAMLELVKRREITVEQDAPFGPIVAQRVATAGPTVAEPDRTDGSAGTDA
jgi:segregation and condensation protein A